MHVEISAHTNFLSNQAIGAAINVHRELGPGLLESVYETCLSYELGKIGVKFERQVPVPIHYDGVALDAELRLDIWIERQLIVEVKAVEMLLPVHHAQVLTYLKITQNRLGLLLNFNTNVLKSGIKRIAL